MTRALVLAVLWIAGSAYADNRPLDAATADAGRELYLQNCATCHGENAAGEVADWHLPRTDGSMPAPPLDGTGHTWHHPLPSLFKTIRDGTTAIGGRMPAHRERLTENQVLTIVYWFTSLWPDEIYATWRGNHDG